MKIFVIIASILLLSACAPKLPLAPAIDETVQIPTIVTPPLEEISAPDLVAQRQQALATQNWGRYLDTTEILLVIATPEQQHSLLLDTYAQLDQINPSFWQQAQTSRHQAWHSLAITHQLPISFQLAWLEDSGKLFHDHPATQQLVSLLSETKHAPKQQRIAILLPFDSRTQPLSNQIRAGILAAYWQTAQQDQLLFFNLEDYTNPIEAYEATQQAGADWVIGPFDRNTIEALSRVANDRLIFLNSAPNASNAWQLQFGTPDSLQQLIYHIGKQDYRNLAVLYADQPNHQQQISKLEEKWLTTPQNRIIPLSFEQNQRNLRDELGRALQSDQSQVRANFLQRTLANNLTFFPRHRGDLDALLLLGEREYLANIQPQLDFFQVNIPVYAMDTLMPTEFRPGLAEPDLKNIRFLSYSAVMSPELISSPLAALGWDSFLITQYHQALLDGLSLNGATGQLRHHEKGLINRQLALVRFNARGQLITDDTQPNIWPFANYTGQPAPMHPREREQRQRELLELITQPNF
ncbi:penicillin-binding protein activator [Thiomicrospira aerophila]|uniref:penicillin-binding protein activator n=1 Tax=Thiomicrospira aerophila TaxID=92245 RepID=UPI00022C262E|nr:penicillin-binding protein activator [Thiomicrospira aerophila]